MECRVLSKHLRLGSFFGQIEILYTGGGVEARPASVCVCVCVCVGGGGVRLGGVSS